MAGIMHLTDTERIVWAAVEETDFEGSVDAPCGAWWTLVLDGNDAEWPLVAQAVGCLADEGYDAHELASFDYTSLKGFWIVREDDRGMLQMTHSATWDEHKARVDDLFQLDRAWNQY